MELTSKQRAFLRSASNQMETILQIGKSGVTDTVVVQVKDALKARELIKIRVLETWPFTPKEAAQALAEATGASVVSVIGSRAVLFLRNPQNIQYDLP